jgi:signal transduction histidine kinase
MTPQNERIAQLEHQLQEAREELEERDRRLEQAERRVQEANRLKSEFLARMSHDLRTPMNAIIGYARILLRRLEGTIEERQFQNLENIQTSAHHLLDLINDILDLSKVETGRVEVHSEKIDFSRLVAECLAATAPQLKEGVALEQDLDGIEVLHTDPDRLRRALANLLSNAAKYTDQGRVEVSARRDGGQISIAVADTGVGIGADELPHIFDEFRQVARKGQTALAGTGLGLAIARRSIELLGGGIAVHSEEGRGSIFTLTLPDTV